MAIEQGAARQGAAAKRERDRDREEKARLKKQEERDADEKKKADRMAKVAKAKETVELAKVAVMTCRMKHSNAKAAARNDAKRMIADADADARKCIAQAKKALASAKESLSYIR